MLRRVVRAYGRIEGGGERSCRRVPVKNMELGASDGAPTTLAVGGDGANNRQVGELRWRRSRVEQGMCTQKRVASA
jgi:hypothetical protein